MIIIDQTRTTTLTEQDKLTLAQLLVKAGYIVHMGRVTIGKRSVSCVHFEERAIGGMSESSDAKGASTR